jgi:uncharacterized cupredoxin-like copper-binding protein
LPTPLHRNHNRDCPTKSAACRSLPQTNPDLMATFPSRRPERAITLLDLIRRRNILSMPVGGIHDASRTGNTTTEKRDGMLHLKKAMISLVLTMALAGGLASAGQADTTIQAFLTNTPDIKDMAKDMAMGMAADTTNAQFGIVLSRYTVPAGKVTFEVLNGSKDMVHEMIVSPLGADGTLPVDAETSRVNEEGAAAMGEVSEIEPVARGSLTLDLTPGKYAVYCNLPGHFQAGMWSILTVN